MNEQGLFSYSNDRAAWPGAGRAAMGDWLEEADLIDAPPLSISRNWHAVTVAAFARLSNHVDVPQDRQISL